MLQKAKRVRQTGFELVSRSCPVGEWEDRILTTRPLARIPFSFGQANFLSRRVSFCMDDF